MAACSGKGSSSDTAGTATDSLCGTIYAVGTEPDRAAELEASSGLRFRLLGEQARLLIPLAGADACVRTEPSATRVRNVQSFVVRSIGGQPVIDGVLVEHDSAYFIRNAEGNEVRVTRLPGAILDEVGTRLWVMVGDSNQVMAAGAIR